MRAHYHPDSSHHEEVEILDIFIDGDGHPKMMFLRDNGHVATAPINRFTELRNCTPPVKRQPRAAERRREGESDLAGS